MTSDWHHGVRAPACLQIDRTGAPENAIAENGSAPEFESAAATTEPGCGGGDLAKLYGRNRKGGVSRQRRTAALTEPGAAVGRARPKSHRHDPGVEYILDESEGSASGSEVSGESDEDIGDIGRLSRAVQLYHQSALPPAALHHRYSPLGMRRKSGVRRNDCAGLS
jgi:hypothetical protein